jgi:hypothetical protein
MQSFKLAKSILDIDCFKQNDTQSESNESTNILLEKIAHIKNRLNSAKTELDDIYTNYPVANKSMKSFDPFNILKYKLGKKYNARNMTIAQLKCYELIYTFHLVPQYADKFVYFDNASFPGGFILATNHLVKTLCKIKQFEWYASSLIHDDSVNLDSYIPLEDTFALYKNYKKRWLMNDNNNGDISKWDNILNFLEQLIQHQGTQHCVDLYTCDLGIDVSMDYNKQEIIHFYLYICQIVCGLMSLKSNGHMIIKHYTIFEPFTISYVSLLSELFRDVYITKPLSSKRTNSETYIVCKNFLYPFDPNSVQLYIYELFIKKVKEGNAVPLISPKYIEKTINSIVLANSSIFNTQINSLQSYIYLVKNMENHVIYKERERLVWSENSNIINKYLKIQFIPIKKEHQLICVRQY